jgi:hypothetical protein
MRRLFFTELQDDLRKISFKNIDPCSLQEGIQLNLGRSHGLNLDDFGCLLLSKQLEDDFACFRCI